MEQPTGEKPTSSELKILQVEDNAGDARLTEILLQDVCDSPLDLHRVSCLHQAIDLLDTQIVDVILLDLNLPDAQELEALEHLHGTVPNKAIIVMTGAHDHTMAIRALQKGAQDYLIKGSSDGDSIWRAIRHSIERKRIEAKLDFLAWYDPLTGLANRMLLIKCLEELLARLSRYDQQGALLFIDLDRFKMVNDNLGHDVGDSLLIEIGNRLKQCVRAGDTVARLGGDEFVLLLEQINESEDAALVAKKVIEVCSKAITLNGHKLYVGASVGITICNNAEDSPKTLLKHADFAMYRAKECGRSNYQYFTKELNARAKAKAALETSLHEAIEAKELEVYFQPRANVADGFQCGAEALLRWNHSTVGNVSPEIFIPLLEETGLIINTGEWVLKNACNQFSLWRNAGILPPSATIGVNLSPRQFMHSHLVETVASTLSNSGLPASSLDLEITESMIMQDAKLAEKTLNQLRELGVNIAIDDFGTGYSCLSCLKQYPLDHLKIDKSFLSNINLDAENAAISSAVISLAHELGLSVIAEGVETIEALEFIREKGCQEYQGYYLSKPLPAKDYEKFLSCANQSIQYH